MNVGAMGDGIRIAVAAAKALVERNIDHGLAGDAVHHQQALDEHGFLLDPLAHTQRIERGPRVGCELDAGTDLTELLRLLEHQNPKALARQGEGAGETADATSGDDHRLGVTRLDHG